MITEHSHTEPTTHFLGVCAVCVRPVRDTVPGVTGRYATLTCPECGGPVTGERLHAVTTTDVCDGRCMGATGPQCSCACGGKNHGGRYIPTAHSEELESAVEAFRARQAALDAQRVEKQRKETDRKVKAFAPWAEQHRDVIDYLAGYDGLSEFVESLSEQVGRYRELSDKQVTAVRRMITKDQERKARDAAFEANRRPVPTGTVTVEGVVLNVKHEDSHHAYGRTVSKMLVECDGYRVWSTVPGELFRVDGTMTGDTVASLTGARVRFTAEVTRSDRDESFGFAKRPRKAERLAMSITATAKGERQ